jgi:predicted transcriptional regulator
VSNDHSDADRAAAVARYVAVRSSVVVAVEYGVTPQTILNWARARGVQVPPIPADASGLAEHIAQALHDKRWCRCPDDRTMLCAESAEVVREALLSFRPGGGG